MLILIHHHTVDDMFSMIQQVRVNFSDEASQHLCIDTPNSLCNRDLEYSILVCMAVEQKLSVIEASKRLAAWTAVDRHILPEHKVIGIGSGTISPTSLDHSRSKFDSTVTGSTVPYVVERIVAQGLELNKDRVFIPTGFQSKELIVKANLRLGDVDQYPTIDVTIDGADEVDKNLNCIKGGGACHLREKVLAEAAVTYVFPPIYLLIFYLITLTSPLTTNAHARSFIVVADYRKNSEVLGTSYKSGVPIEVATFAYAKLLQNLHHLGAPAATLRMAKAKAGPVVSDNGNFIIDAPFPQEMLREPYSVRFPLLIHMRSFSLFPSFSVSIMQIHSTLTSPPYFPPPTHADVQLLQKIKMLTGVVEVGLFCHMVKAAYFGNQVRLPPSFLSRSIAFVPVPTPRSSLPILCFSFSLFHIHSHPLASILFPLPFEHLAQDGSVTVKWDDQHTERVERPTDP
ncbi:hypothetical protein EW146_g10263 [Bondarzewia mesenterica]|uniref:Ribose-5-phosphate isomerase n=1 Tax=Bondarzewia mesenterica TaxID=1095465 RepID=A0A4S4KZ50_9AGAM|nr:hypothetical protein EW146_g10263 [Bondarzewia mesenterica]